MIGRGREIRGPAAYAVGVGAALAAWLARAPLEGVLPTGYPFLTFYPAIMVTAYCAGLRPAVTCAVLSGLLSWWFFIAPTLGYGLTFGSALSVGFFAFVAWVEIYFIVGMRRAIATLEQERARHAALAENRDLLLREMQHRVSNNIHMVSGLLRLQATASPEPAVSHALIEASSRLSVVARIQRGLQDAAGRTLGFQEFAREIVADALTAAGANAVEAKVEGDDAPLHPEQATAVCLVMLECVNNALEHAYGPAEPGAITVRLEAEGDRRVLTVTDDGAGLADGFDPDKTKSLGLRIARAMAAQLEGRFTLTPAPGGRGAVGRLEWAAKSL